MFGVFDIGGTHIRIGVSKNFDTVEKSIILNTPENFEEGMDILSKNIVELSGGDKILSVAGGIAGPLDSKKQMLITSPHISSWVGKSIVENLSEKIKAPVFLENDSALGSLGEAVYGAGKGYKIVACLAIGTGVGGAVIISGQIAKNKWGFEPGHQIIFPGGNEDACGKKGHLEAYVGGKAIEKIYKQKAENITDSEIWEQIAKNLAIGLNNTIVHWSPSIVIIAGAVGLNIPLKTVTSELYSLMTIFSAQARPEIVYGTLGKINGLYGALQFLKTRQ